MTMAPLHSDYTIAWVCALPLEMAAAKAMLDEIHSPLPQPPTDPNAYILGKVNGHYVVLASLPAGIYGTTSAATIVPHLVSTFPRVQFGLMVGIGGGVPSKSNDIRLGDVVVSKPTEKYGGVVQYDYGKMVQGGQLKQTGMLNHPPLILLSHIARLQADHINRRENSISAIVWDILEQNSDMKDHFSPPGQDTDYLFDPSYSHADQDRNCMQCDRKQLVPRKLRATNEPQIHYGLIASGDQLMKDSKTRDHLAKQLGIICFEMEAAGLMNQLPTLVIRGICDYSDSHKQKEWQGYAALTAAAYTKVLLSIVPVYRTEWDLASHRKEVRHWMVPFSRNTRFVGRHIEITKLEKLITLSDGPRRIAITGLGGIGKTQVALELAHRIRDQDKACSIFWIPCTSHEIFDQACISIAQMLGLHHVKPTEVREQVKVYLSSERAGKWLLIFDNADDQDMWLQAGNAAPALKDFLPQSEVGCILFTTRNRYLAVELTSSHIIPIPDVDKETARELLERLLLQKSLLNNDTAVTTLLEQLTFLPLAITQASAYINKNGISLSAYLGLLEQQEFDVVELLSKDFEDEGRYRDIQNPVATTWLISFQQIQHQDKLAADYLSFMACIHPRNIPLSLLPFPPSTTKKIEALGFLNAYSFITWQDGDQSISLHRLVHLATRSWLKKNRIFSYWIHKVAERGDEAFPNNNYKNRKVWQQYLPHALALLYENEFTKQREQYITLINKVADCLDSDGRYHEAEVLYSHLVQIRQRKNGPEDPSTLTSMANLASTFQNQGRWKEANELEIQVLEIRKTVLGAEHPDTLNSMVNLALIFRNQGQWKKAEELGMQVLETRKTVLGAEHPDTLASMGSLALTFQKQGRWKEAEELGMQVLETRKTVLGAEHPDTLASMGSLAKTFRKQGRWKEAEELGMHALETRKTVLGPEHPDTLASMGSLASIFQKQGRWKEAEEIIIQVLEIRKTVLGAEHPDTLTSMNNLASIFWNQGQWKEAEELGIQVLKIRKTVLGAEHPDTLKSMANLASTFSNQGRWKEAEELEMQVLKIRKTVLGAEHPDTLTSMNNLAYTWRSLGKRNDALALMTQCTELRDQFLGRDHPDYKSSAATVTKWGQTRKRDILRRILYQS